MAPGTSSTGTGCGQAAPSAAELESLRLEVREFAGAELLTGRAEVHANSWLAVYDRDFTRRLAERGWIGMTWPTAYGGHGRSEAERQAVIEELLAAGLPLAAHWAADRQVGPSLLRYGTEAQRLRFLPAIATGAASFCIGMSEADAGSDLAAVRMRATPVVGGWLVSGAKLWVSHASHADFMLTLCRSELVTADRHAGMTRLIIDLHLPGVTIRPIATLDGSAHFAEVALDGAFVPNDMVVGTPGTGWQQVISELAYERSGPERILSSFPLLAETWRVIRQMGLTSLYPEMGRQVARLWVLREMSAGLALSREPGGEASAVQAALVKDLGTQFEADVIEFARLLPSEVRASSSAATFRRLLDEVILAAPGFTLRGGTTQILRTVVARAETP